MILRININLFFNAYNKLNVLLFLLSSTFIDNKNFRVGFQQIKNSDGFI